MPRFVEFSREDARSRREEPVFTLQARGVISMNGAAFGALGRPEFVSLLYDSDEAVVGLRKADGDGPTAYAVRKQSTAQSYVVAAQGFTAFHGIQTVRARRFLAHNYGQGIWGFALGEGQSVPNRRATRREPLITNRWRHTTNGFDVPSLTRLGDINFSHPAYTNRRGSAEEQPSVRIGMLVAGEPLGLTPPTTELYRLFCELLASPPIAELVNSLRGAKATGYEWTPYGGHGRVNLEAALVPNDGSPTAVASARLLPPDAAAQQFGRDPRVADLVLDVRRSCLAPAATQVADLLAWGKLFVQALALPRILADFLNAELHIATSNEPSAQLGIWMRTPHGLTELVDVGSLSAIPGTQTQSTFTGYVIADSTGGSPERAAYDLLTQMCDYTLHVTDYEQALQPLIADNDRTSAGARARRK